MLTAVIFSIFANSHSLLQSGQAERVLSQRCIQSRWNTWPQFPQVMLRPAWSGSPDVQRRSSALYKHTVHGSSTVQRYQREVTCGICLILYAGLIPANTKVAHQWCCCQLADTLPSCADVTRACCPRTACCRAHRLLRQMVQVSVEMFQLHMATAFHFFMSNMVFGFP